MPLVLKDRVRETTTSTGTGTITLAGAVSGFQSFSAIGNGNTTYYAIIDSVNGTWEVGIGTYTSAGTTLSRTTVLSSSNGGSLVTFAAGTKDVICTQPSAKAIYADETNNVGVGLTPSTWSSGDAIEVGFAGNALWGYSANESYLTNNLYYNAGFKYASTNPASHYRQYIGTHAWWTAPSGSTGGAATMTLRMLLDNSGRLAIGSTAPQSWSTSQAVIEMYPSNGGGYINMNGASTFGGYLYWNMYFNGTSNICINTGAVGAAGMNGSGGHDVYVGTGTAGSAASLTLATSVDSSANFMVGTSSSTGAGGLTIQSVTNGRTVYNNNNGAATGFVFQTFRRSGTEIGSITQNGTTAVLYNTTSDYRLKENVQPISGALDRVAKLKPSTYRWKSDGSDGEGFLAHELAEVCPLAVNGKKDAVDAKGDPKYQSIDPSKVVALLTAAVQELTQQVRELKAEVAALKGN